MQLYLIRHPPPEVAEGVCYGRTNLPLAQDAAIAAARIEARLPPELPVYSSPLQRCWQLAEILHPAPQSDPRVLEMDFGLWEMQPWSTLGRAALDQWAADPLGFTPPQGESVGQLQARVLDFIEELVALDLNAAGLVSHAGVMKVIVGHARQLGVRQWMMLKFEYEEVVCVTIEHRGW
ncbi:MAG: histidine phosphatase family protein [Burkholderiaceae bacterium]|nr:histidine phosphatase family protein [Sulfuritalea sp.]MCF8176715.1 histidine phosphatase family protein [Burkholderiaceae bacterium]MCF8185106.1 histidine phosphatase family protein [Polynucleobacter sp.]